MSHVWARRGLSCTWLPDTAAAFWCIGKLGESTACAWYSYPTLYGVYLPNFGPAFHPFLLPFAPHITLTLTLIHAFACGRGSGAYAGHPRVRALRSREL